ncbi:hypothetical protein [Streptomyces sp. A30]|uniref:hypothetical protein n=1 Tax=Streptomyces sp. A30 TaxID=2789273 RepID=UPI00397FC69E
MGLARLDLAVGDDGVLLGDAPRWLVEDGDIAQELLDRERGEGGVLTECSVLLRVLERGECARVAGRLVAGD